MSDREHAILSASGAHRWLTCTPSVQLTIEEGREDNCSVYAAEGTVAHRLAELRLSLLYGRMSQEEFDKEFAEFMAEDDTKTYYSAEMEEFVADHIATVKRYTDNLEHYHILFEVRVNFSNFVPQGFGTADVLIVADNGIFIIDLKYGQGVPVSAHDNPQLRLYALGALNLFPNSETITTVISQPRLLSVDSEITTKKELVDWGFNYVLPRAEQAIKGEGTLTPSENACRFCALRGKCKARADAQLALAQQEFNIVEQEQKQVVDLSPEQIANILSIAPKFIDFFKDVQAFAMGQLSAGVKIPGYKLVEGRSNRVITDQAKVKQKLLDLGIAEELITEPAKLLGISKLEALIGKKLFTSLCGDYIVKPQGKLTLAPESDQRPEVNALPGAEFLVD